MPWGKIDDNFYNHPKTIRAGAEGIAMFVCGLSYCMRYLTDGFILEEMIPQLVAVTDPIAVAGRLVEVGYWHKVAGGYLIHDFLDYNPSAARIKADREASAKRQAEWRQRQSEERNGVTNGVINASSQSQSQSQSQSHSESQSRGGGSKSPNDAYAPSAAAMPQSPRSGVLDPSSLTVKEIAKLDLDKDEWRALGQLERAGKARAGVAAIVERKLRMAPPAVEVYREIAERYPAKALWAAIENAVGTEQDDLDLWGRVIMAWIGNGWKPTNVRGMLDYFERREIPAPTGLGRAPPGTPLSRSLAAIEEWGQA